MGGFEVAGQRLLGNTDEEFVSHALGVLESCSGVRIAAAAQTDRIYFSRRTSVVTPRTVIKVKEAAVWRSSALFPLNPSIPVVARGSRMLVMSVETHSSSSYDAAESMVLRTGGVIGCAI